MWIDSIWKRKGKIGQLLVRSEVNYIPLAAPCTKTPARLFHTKSATVNVQPVKDSTDQMDLSSIISQQITFDNSAMLFGIDRGAQADRDWGVALSRIIALSDRDHEMGLDDQIIASRYVPARKTKKPPG